MATQVARANYVMGYACGKVSNGFFVPDTSSSPGRRKAGAVTLLLGKFMPQNSAFDEHKDELEHYEQMFGRDRGRLAVSLDRLTNALVLVGQHGVYCTSQRNPTVPAMDLRMVVQELTHAKELMQSIMEELKKSHRDGGSLTR